jgi:rubrerythrin
MDTYNLSTQRELFRILEEAIKDEDEARDTYAEAANHTDDPEVKAFLMELAAMEQQHHVLLENKLNELKAVAEIQDEICEAYD